MNLDKPNAGTLTLSMGKQEILFTQFVNGIVNEEGEWNEVYVDLFKPS